MKHKVDETKTKYLRPAAVTDHVSCCEKVLVLEVAVIARGQVQEVCHVVEAGESLKHRQ